MTSLWLVWLLLLGQVYDRLIIDRRNAIITSCRVAQESLYMSVGIIACVAEKRIESHF